MKNQAFTETYTPSLAARGEQSFEKEMPIIHPLTSHTNQIMKETIMKKYLVAILTFGAFVFSAGISLAPAQAKDLSTMGLQTASTELPACPSLFRCVVK